MSLIVSFVIGAVFLAVSLIHQYHAIEMDEGITSGEILGVFGMLLMICSVAMGVLQFIWKDI